jgi:hypothetical protein
MVTEVTLPAVPKHDVSADPNPAFIDFLENADYSNDSKIQDVPSAPFPSRSQAGCSQRDRTGVPLDRRLWRFARPVYSLKPFSPGTLG